MFIPTSLLLLLAVLMTVAVCTVVFNTLTTAKMADDYRSIKDGCANLQSALAHQEAHIKAVDEGAGEKLQAILGALSEHEKQLASLNKAIAPEATETKSIPA